MPLNLQALLDHYRPTFILHSDEEYYPCDMHDYVKHSSLHVDEQPIDIAKRIELLMQADPTLRQKLIAIGVDLNRPQLTYELLIFFSVADWKGGLTGELRLKPDDSILVGTPTQQVPIYGAVSEERILDNDNVEKSVYALRYVATYAYDTAYASACCCSLPCKCPSGQHFGDIEHVTVYVLKNDDQTSGAILKMYYSAHGSSEGVWVSADQLTYHTASNNNQATHPCVFVSKGTHAHYPQGGLWSRIFGFVNDITGEEQDGLLWQPTVTLDTRLLEYGDDNNYFSYGFGDVTLPKSYLLDYTDAPDRARANTDPGRSSNWTMRFFCLPFSNCFPDSCYESVKDCVMENDHKVLSSRRLR